MIFTVVAEDFGFVGALVLLILYVTLIYRILKLPSSPITNFIPIFPSIYHDAGLSYF